MQRSRIDRFIREKSLAPRRDVRLILAQGRVTIDGAVATDPQQIINKFSHVTLDGRVLQDNTPRYVMLHKPVGVVSATKDCQHRTVMDLLDKGVETGLHITGRLDLNSSGLMLLTNDSSWSEQLTSPCQKVSKKYRVTVAHSLSEEYIQAFAAGMYFGYEDITTQPAKLDIISERVAEVTLVEGRYHQIKRMFGRFRNPVHKIHRIAIGQVQLDPFLSPGQSRMLTPWEISNIS